MSFTYREHRPTGVLARAVHCLWSLRGTTTGHHAESILPDGCPEVLLNCADPVVQVLPNGVFATQPRLAMVGEVRRPVIIAQGPVVDLLGIRLIPQGLGLLFEQPADRIVDGTHDLEALISQPQRAELVSALNCDDVDERFRLAEGWLRRRLQRSRTDDRLIRKAVQFVDATSGTLPIDQLAQRLSVQRRTLERAFEQQVGISPKALSRVRRFRRAHALLEAGQSITEAAHLSGYFDQAHLCRDFQTFSGRSPGRYLSGARELDQLFA